MVWGHRYESHAQENKKIQAFKARIFLIKGSCKVTICKNCTFFLWVSWECRSVNLILIPSLDLFLLCWFVLPNFDVTIFVLSYILSCYIFSMNKNLATRTKVKVDNWTVTCTLWERKNHFFPNKSYQRHSEGKCHKDIAVRASSTVIKRSRGQTDRTSVSRGAETKTMLSCQGSKSTKMVLLCSVLDSENLVHSLHHTATHILKVLWSQNAEEKQVVIIKWGKSKKP